MTPPKIFETKRLILRIPTLNDASSIFNEYACDPEVTKYLTWKTHSNIEQTKEFLEMTLKNWEEKTIFSWAITLKENNKLIGMITFRNGKFKIDLGYVLSRHFWNQGLMTEAAEAIILWAKNENSIWRIWAFHDIDNPQSGKVLEKIGLKKEGILKCWSTHPNISSIPKDCISYCWVRN